VQSQAREKLLQDATRLAMDDVALIPLHHQASIWAMKRGMNYPGRLDERTHAMEFAPSVNAAAARP
jgi:peptide/nickel transport system substrate-binding protein